MNRFFRSALFPLIVIVLLVYLASQTFIGGGGEEKDVTYSALISEVRSTPERFEKLTFDPDKRSIKVEETEAAEGGTYSVNYPSDEAQLEFQKVLQDEGVTFDSKGTGGFSIVSLLISLLPFILLIGFWIFFIPAAAALRSARRTRPGRDRQPA